MDALEITAATLVAKWAAEGTVKEAAKSAWAGLHRVYDVISGKLSRHDGGLEALSRLEQEPESEGRIRELAELLGTSLESDPSFAIRLQEAVDEVEKQPGMASFVTEIKGNAAVGKFIQVGSVDGDFHA